VKDKGMTPMSGLFACVTSCIGGKDEKYAVKVKPIEHEVYFVYKTLGDFENLWKQLASFVSKQVEKEDSTIIQWLATFVQHHSLQSLLDQLETRQKEMINTLNTFLQPLVRRVTAWMETFTNTNIAEQLVTIVKKFLECTKEDQQLDALESQRWKKRSFSEMRPEDELVAQRRTPSPLFHSRCNMSYFENRSPKFRRLSMMEEGECVTSSLPFVHKSRCCSLPTPYVASRRRVYAEVDFE
jgi:hypothetical protein